jgi:poly(3-hydroxyalkanoate) synthetase
MTPPRSMWDPWLWPLAATMQVGEAALRSFGELLSPDGRPEPAGSEPLWATPHAIALELPTLRVRDFSVGQEGCPTFIVAPFALHGATVADFAPRHSLVRQLLADGLQRLMVVECQSATPAMRFLSIDSYLADLAVAVEDVGGPVNLVGLCQGGWLAVMFAARFPQKVTTLVLAGSPVDLDAARSSIVDATRMTRPEFFEGIVWSGEGRILGQHMLKFWGVSDFDSAAMARVLQVDDPLPHELVARFRHWHRSPVNLPGTYYLQVVEQLFRHNQLAKGQFRALGRTLDLAAIKVPIYLLVGRDDEVTPPDQALALGRVVGTPRKRIRTALTRCGHLSLFMGARTLAADWPRIAKWLAANSSEAA